MRKINKIILIMIISIIMSIVINIGLQTKSINIYAKNVDFKAVTLTTTNTREEIKADKSNLNADITNSSRNSVGNTTTLNTNTSNNTTNTNTSQTAPTVSQESTLPKAGLEPSMVFALAGMIVLAVVLYVKVVKYNLD